MIKSVEYCSNDYKKKRVKLHKYRVVLGQNRRVKERHKGARNCYKNAGRPRLGNLFVGMNKSRKNFKRELKICKNE